MTPAELAEIKRALAHYRAATETRHPITMIRKRRGQKLGSRTMRRQGVKSHGATRPRAALRKAIDEWIAAGRPEQSRWR